MPEQQTQTERVVGHPSISQVSVTGMTCGNCVRHVTQAIQNIPGVRGATVSLDTGEASIRWANDAKPNVPAVVEAIQKEGYGAEEIDASGGHGHHESGDGALARWQFYLWIGILGTAPLMIGEWIFGLGDKPWFRFLSFLLASMVQVSAGAPFYRGAWNQLKVRSSNMDTLVALGSTTAFAYSVWALFTGQSGHLYFMEAAAIITLISIGHWMESRVSARASSALRQLLSLAPATARRRNPDGAEIEVPVAELKVGDLVSLRPGDRVPVDGEVVEGASSVDESMLTGESMPVEKTAGSEVYAGTVNRNGRLVMRVKATGEETALAHIVAAVQRAQTSRANIQRLGDRVSNVFVPVVVAIALLAALWWAFAPESARAVHESIQPFLWHAQLPSPATAAPFVIAAAVLIIACPCAMGLATPAAIMAGTNAAAQRGILVRDGVALEKAGAITAVIFDKTGTLTQGQPVVVQTWESPSANTGAPSVSRLAAALTRHSTHPLSQAVAATASGEVALTDWRELRGLGVEAKARLRGEANSVVRLGSLSWLREVGVDLAAADEFLAEWTAQGATVLGVAADGVLLGLFAVKDALKPGASAVVERLYRQGLKVYLVTGDNRLTAGSIARQAGIPAENVFAEVRPEHKAEFVKKLQRQGERVAFVGDGINDAPALEQADLGIAVSRASDIAREAADIILLKSEIEAVPESLGLARATLRTIRQNLFWAFFYNAVGVPLAALGFMSPILCAAAMALSDIIVIGNALRLRGWRLKA